MAFDLSGSSNKALLVQVACWQDWLDIVPMQWSVTSVYDPLGGRLYTKEAEHGALTTWLTWQWRVPSDQHCMGKCWCLLISDQLCICANRLPTGPESRYASTRFVQLFLRPYSRFFWCLNLVVSTNSVLRWRTTATAPRCYHNIWQLAQQLTVHFITDTSPMSLGGQLLGCHVVCEVAHLRQPPNHLFIRHHIPWE